MDFVFRREAVARGAREASVETGEYLASQRRIGGNDSDLLRARRLRAAGAVRACAAARAQGEKFWAAHTAPVEVV